MSRQRARVATMSPRQRLREAQPLLIMTGIVMVCLILLSAISTRSTDRRDYSADNVHDEGSAALVEVLRSRGIDVYTTSSPDEALARAARPDTTLAVAGARVPLNFQMYTEPIQSIVWIDTPVMTGPEFDGVSFSTFHELSSDSSEPADAPTVRLLETATCRSSAAHRAHEVTQSDTVVSVHEPWTGCFEQSSGKFAFAEKNEGDRYRAIIPGGTVVQNSTITHAGNAALALNALGRHSHLVWYVGANDHSMMMASPPPPLPLWLKYSIVLLALTMAMLAWTKCARLGRLVPENFPTPVPAIETVQGRGRLLRSNHAHAHAATALRVHSARKIARHLGVPEHASRAALMQAISATGVDATRAEHALWGSSPTTDHDLAHIAQELKELEADIRHD